jgi:hypothetical protein
MEWCLVKYKDNFTFIGLWVRSTGNDSSTMEEIQTTEMKLMQPLLGFTQYDHKYNEEIKTKPKRH